MRFFVTMMFDRWDWDGDVEASEDAGESGIALY